MPLSLCVPLAHSSYSLLRPGPALAQGSATAPGLPRAAGLLALPSALLRLATKAWLAGEGDCGWWAGAGASQPPTRIGHSRARSSVLTRPLTAANCRKRARSWWVRGGGRGGAYEQPTSAAVMLITTTALLTVRLHACIPQHQCMYAASGGVALCCSANCCSTHQAIVQGLVDQASCVLVPLLCCCCRCLHSGSGFAPLWSHGIIFPALSWVRMLRLALHTGCQTVLKTVKATPNALPCPDCGGMVGC